MEEYILIVLTFAVAVVGIIWEKPPLSAKIALFIFALATSVATVYKLHEDKQDKEFFRHALTSTLRPTNSEYQRIYNDIEPELGKKAYGNTYPCHHFDDGLTCFLQNEDGTKRGTLVLNRGEVAKFFANHIRGATNTSLAQELFAKKYLPSVDNEEFLDKVGIVGFAVFYNMRGAYPRTYNYDDSFGVKVVWDEGGRERSVQINPDEVRGISPESGLSVFRTVELLYRKKFQEPSPEDTKSPGTEAQPSAGK